MQDVKELYALRKFVASAAHYIEAAQSGQMKPQQALDKLWLTLQEIHPWWPELWSDEEQRQESADHLRDILNEQLEV